MRKWRHIACGWKRIITGSLCILMTVFKIIRKKALKENIVRIRDLVIICRKLAYKEI